MNTAFALIASLFVILGSQDEVTASHARIQTSMGDIDLELYTDEAPVTVENFLRYATSGLYDQTIFHRVIKDTLIQGGGFNRYLNRRATFDPIMNEATNGLKNVRGTIAMARQHDPDSATSHFFINLQDNPDLDRKNDIYSSDAGYAVFGKVVAGMEIADAIGDVETGSAEGGVYLEQDVPTETILILRIDPISAEDVGATATE